MFEFAFPFPICCTVPLRPCDQAIASASNCHSLYETASSTLWLLECEQSCPCCSFKYVVNSFSRQRGTFQIFPCSNLVCNFRSFPGGDKVLWSLSHLLNGDRVFPKIFLQTNKYDWNVGTSLVSLLNPLMKLACAQRNPAEILPCAWHCPKNLGCQWRIRSG